MIMPVEVHVLQERNIIYKVVADSEEQAEQVREDIVLKLKKQNVDLEVKRYAFSGTLTLITMHIIS